MVKLRVYKKMAYLINISRLPSSITKFQFNHTHPRTYLENFVTSSLRFFQKITNALEKIISFVVFSKELVSFAFFDDLVSVQDKKKKVNVLNI